MPAYDDRHFAPPAPIIQATLRNLRTGARTSGVTLLIDTGADVTLIPQAAADAIGLDHSEARYELVGFDGTKTSAEAIRAGLSFLGRTFRGRFLLIDDRIGIVGRDILNSLSLLFDGPHLSWEEHSSPAKDA
jgi:predicted aspartyl protease